MEYEGSYVDKKMLEKMANRAKKQGVGVAKGKRGAKKSGVTAKSKKRPLETIPEEGEVDENELSAQLKDAPPPMKKARGRQKK